MGRCLPNQYAPYGTCPKCGWAGRYWGFKYHNFCRTCYNQWGKKKAEENREYKFPKINVSIADGIIVTENVRNRLRRQAKHAVGPNPAYWLARIIPLIIVLCTVYLIRTVGQDPDSGFKLTVTMFGGFFLACLSFGIFGGAWERQVDVKITELAKARKKKIEEQLRFYNSPEWGIIREQIIREQGRFCQECGREIKDDFDLTVDHIKPRSKFPEFALDASNLRVLCRSCNSTKGASYDELGVTPEKQVN